MKFNYNNDASSSANGQQQFLQRLSLQEVQAQSRWWAHLLFVQKFMFTSKVCFKDGQEHLFAILFPLMNYESLLCID